MKEYSFQINKNIVRIIMCTDPDIEDHEVKVWGFPYANKNKLLEEDWEIVLNYVKGHFFAFKEKNKCLILACDLVANYRMYYIEKENEFVFSDDYNILINELKCEYSLSLDEDQFAYWKKHRFTLGDSSLFYQIKKMPPAHIFEISDRGLNKKCYYKLYERIENYNKLLSDNYQDLQESIKSAYESYSGNQVLLLFSGGTDSTLLACILKRLKIPFVAIILKFLPLHHDNLNDVYRAQNVAKKIGIENVVVLEIDLLIAVNNIELILDNMLFDRHLSVHFFAACEKISKSFGTDVLLINGQSSDSILSFGPSDCTWGGFIRRMVLYSNRFIRSVLAHLINYKLGFALCVPQNKHEKFEAFIDETDYFYLKDMKMKYVIMLKEKVDLVQSYFSLLDDNNSRKIILSQLKKYEESFLMYLKIFSFIQGPDNLIVIKSAECNGIRNIVMPFTSPQFIYNVVRYKSDIKELFYPKYFVRDILENQFEYHSYYNQYKDITNMEFEDFDIKSHVLKIDNLFLEHVTNIMKNNF